MRASARFLVATSSVAFAVHFLYKMQINVKSSNAGFDSERGRFVGGMDLTVKVTHRGHTF